MGLSVDQIPVLEEFTSIQGEGRNLGVPYVFIRVGGCPLRCRFCDSEYTWKVDRGSIKGTHEVARGAISRAIAAKTEWISITGGEPLLYPQQLLEMMQIFAQFSNRSAKTHIETSGRYYNEAVHHACQLFSMDIKTPCTNEVRESDLDHLKFIRPQDQVKCLIETLEDLDYAYIVRRRLNQLCPLVLQPFNTKVNIDTDDKTLDLIDKYRWLVETTLHGSREFGNVIISPQVHVMIWGNTPST